jgi:AraC-like DNA-binding protein
MDGFSRIRRSTGDVASTDASAYWSDVVCDTFVGVAVRPDPGRPFEGRIEHSAVDGIGFSALTASAQHVARTRNRIRRDREEFFLANIQIRGEGRAEQNGRTARLAPGTMTFLDSARPYTLNFDRDFAQLVVKVPRSRLPGRSLAGATAVELTASGPGRLVADFLVGLDRLQQHDAAGAAMLVPHAIDLLDTALSWAAVRTLPETTAEALTLERIRRFVRRHAHDSDLTAESAAAACGISRRTLFRVLASDEESLTGMIRRLRVTHAQQLILANPARPLAVVAHECGFGGEAQLNRAFRAVAGTTPGAYRTQRRDAV